VSLRDPGKPENSRCYLLPVGGFAEEAESFGLGGAFDGGLAVAFAGFMAFSLGLQPSWSLFCSELTSLYPAAARMALSQLASAEERQGPCPVHGAAFPAALSETARRAQGA
jgi:hypothetical protein